MYKNIYIFLIGNLILRTYATYFCSKDEQGRPVFYDGETANRLCTQCKLNGANEWKYECFPCCYKGQDTTTTITTTTMTTTARTTTTASPSSSNVSNVSISISISVVILIFVIIVFIVVYKKRKARQCWQNQNNTKGVAPTPATETTIEDCKLLLPPLSNCQMSCSSSIPDTTNIAAKPVQEQNDEAERQHTSVAIQEQGDQEESVV